MTKATHVRLVLTALALAYLTYPIVGGPIGVGLDYSYVFAFNHFFAHDVPWGKEILFTYGPLGFLFHPEPVGANMAVGYAVHSLVHLTFLAICLYAGTLARERRSLGAAIAVTLIAAILASFSRLEHELVLSAFLLAVLHAETRRLAFLVAAGFVAAFAAVVKPSFGIYGASAVLTFTLLGAWRTRDFRPPTVATASLAGFFLLIWLLVNGTLTGVLRFARATLELTSGYGSAMSDSPEMAWGRLLGSAACFAAIPLLCGGKRTRILYGSFVPTLWAAWKWGAGRAGHLDGFAEYLVLIVLAGLLYADPRGSSTRELAWRRMGSVVLGAACLILFASNMRHVGRIDSEARYYELLARRLFQPRGPWAFRESVAQWPMFHEKLEQASVLMLRSRVLSPEVREAIGDEPVDVYPWEASAVAANDLTWRPRPIFQSYTCYTPWLDSQNAIWFATPAAPRFLLWFCPKQDVETDSIDGRYLLSDEPRTMAEILRRYRPLRRGPKSVLFERSEAPLFAEARAVGALTASWNQWIDVPLEPPPGSVLRASIGIERALLGALKKTLYKELAVHIEYRLADGTVREHRLVVDNAPSGVWISPYVTDLAAGWRGAPVEAIRLAHHEDDFFEPSIPIEWRLLERADEPDE